MKEMISPGNNSGHILRGHIVKLNSKDQTLVTRVIPGFRSPIIPSEIDDKVFGQDVSSKFWLHGN